MILQKCKSVLTCTHFQGNANETKSINYQQCTAAVQNFYRTLHLDKSPYLVRGGPALHKVANLPPIMWDFSPPSHQRSSPLGKGWLLCEGILKLRLIPVPYSRVISNSECLQLCLRTHSVNSWWGNSWDGMGCHVALIKSDERVSGWEGRNI